MAAILRFAQKDRENSSNTPPVGPAEIIIFPGVRFERLESFNQPEDGKPNGNGPMQQHAAR